MKRTLTLALIVLRAILPTMAQTPSDTLMMDLDIEGGLLQLDSVYPPGCWQIGQPNKPVFTSAYSIPNALVTDTLLPHPASLTCYAEFSPLIDDQGYIGKWLSFRHRMDMDSLQSFGWVETKGEFQSDWARIGYWTDWSMQLTDFIGDGSITDTGVVFTGTNAEWTDVEMTMDCIAVINGEGERGGGPAVRKYRFVFQGNANGNARDGWMIDDVRLSSRACMGGELERRERPLLAFPIPASDKLTIDGMNQGPGRCDLVDAQGRVLRTWMRSFNGAWDLDVQSLPNGAYAIRTFTENEQAMARFVVHH